MRKTTQTASNRLTTTTGSSHYLKKFRHVERGPWSDIPANKWGNWNWQLKNRITSTAQLQELLPDLTQEELDGVELANSKLAMSITPYFFNLIDPNNPDCPIRRQVIPRISESFLSADEMPDPCGEDQYTPVPGLVHRYPDRVLLLVTDRCAAYCRYCTRSRLVGKESPKTLPSRLDRQIKYISSNPVIRDVLISGGDPLLFSDNKLASILERLRKIPHVEFIRIGTRIPIFLPQRITQTLCNTLRRYHPLFISVHVNHPNELTAESKEALEMLANAGIPLGNQSVLLRGINDDPEIMRALVHKLLICRVKPYYLYQCDLIHGSAHLRTSVHTGIDLINSLRGHTTGYAVPQYVIDAPGGGGKIPINPENILSFNKDRLVLKNHEGKVFEYIEAVKDR
ncbi:MAG: KamA family radical SAM protein [Verrucomicrobia bacterium]|nr:KamA family radical SAM protein [Verrucomicrobiota bacterium]